MFAYWICNDWLLGCFLQALSIPEYCYKKHVSITINSTRLDFLSFSSILRFLDKKKRNQYYLVSKCKLIKCYQLSSILLLKMLPPWPCLLLLYAFFMAAWFLSKLPPLNSREHEILIRRARAPISIFLWCLLLSLLAFIKFIIRSYPLWRRILAFTCCYIVLPI